MYVLIPVTLIVWGLIIYRIVAGLKTENEVMPTYSPSSLANKQVVADTFSINPSYRDPFLGKVMERKREGTEVKTEVKPAAPPQVLQWPAIIYGGTIRNAKLNKEMIMIQINGQEYTMKKGETVNGVQVIAAFNDSIQVSFSKEKKYIHK